MSTTASSSWNNALLAALVVVLPACDATSPADSACPPPGAASRAAEAVARDANPVVGLVPSSDPQVTAALVEGARLAFDHARAAGGPSIDLVVGAASTQWGSAAAEAVRLACDLGAVALVAPPDRALAHPVAQAATRCGVPVLSTSRVASVTAAGSRHVLSVVAADVAAADQAEDLAPPPFDADAPASAAFASAFRSRFGRTPGGWAAAGYDAARVVVEAVRRAGLSRRDFVGAVTHGTPVTGAGGDVTFGTLGRRQSARN